MCSALTPSDNPASNPGRADAGNSAIGGPYFPGFGKVLAEAGQEEELIVATLNFDQLAAWYDWLPWREWRLGPQRGATELIAREFNAIAEKVEG